MTSASTVRLDSQTNPQPVVSREGWVWIVALGALFCCVYWNFILRTYQIAMRYDDWSHALVVPFISLFYIYYKRADLARLPRRVCWWGLPLLFIGLGGYALGIYPIRNDMAQGYSMLLALFGLVLFLLGPSMMKVLWFPIAYLFFAVKISQRIWEQIAAKLQFVASEVSTVVLQIISAFANFQVENRGATIELMFKDAGGQWVTDAFNVAEACAGLRMLMAFIALGVAMAFLTYRPVWQRVIMLAMTVPIAVLVNVGRVVTIGLIFMKDKDMATGDFHIFVGLLMLIPAGLLFLLLAWVLDHLFIHEESDTAQRQSAKPGPAKPVVPLKDSPEPVNRIWMVKGVIGGALVMLLFSTSYVLMLGYFRPDLIDFLSPTAVRILLPICVVALLAGLIYLPKLMPVGAARGAWSRRLVALGVCTGVLVTSAVGQQTVIATTKAVLHKESVPLRADLRSLGSFGTWSQVELEPLLSAELETELGTRMYMSGVYQDERWPADQPGGKVRLHVAYYTGTPDTVPHVPERCFTAGGAGYLEINRNAELTLDGPEYSRREGDHWLVYSAIARGDVRLPARQFRGTIFTYGSRPGESEQTANIVYFFAANGQFLPTPDHVRAQGFNLRDKYAYYCKVEVNVPNVADQELALERASSFLSAAMPDIMACLPDWVDVTEGRWPAGTNDTQ